VRPVPRRELEDAYWYFAAERQQIFAKRVRGDPPPWTQDPVLGEYKFCNAYRASDRVSQYLIRSVIYDGVDRSPEDVLLRIVLFRLFSRETTWSAIEEKTGGLSVSSFDPTKLARFLDRLRQKQAIYTSAFILCANPAYGRPGKHRNHLALVEHMLRSGLPRRVAKARSLEDIYNDLLEYPLIGPFMAYQLAIDLNYSELIDFSENDFTVPGPGAVRGLRKVFSDFGKYSPAELIMRMVDHQDAAFAARGLEFEGLFGRPLQAIDCQNLFCEVDKYARVTFPELKSNRVRIKTRFRQTAPTLEPFYPPKWGLDAAADTRWTQLSHAA
jgi:hypothetical protein